MPKYRDVQAFADRARGYGDGALGQMRRDLVTKSIDLALSVGPAPRRVLDVGCGAGLLLRELSRRLPEASELTGVDAVQAGQLPFDDRSFDLVIAATSFDHWTDQRAGLAECHRVLTPGGRLLLTDLFSLALLPTLIGGRADRARTQLRATKMLAAAGFRSVVWHRLNSGVWLTGIFRAVTASA